MLTVTFLLTVNISLTSESIELSVLGVFHIDHWLVLGDFVFNRKF